MSLTEMAGGMGGLMNTVSCVRNAARATTAKLAQPIHPLAYRVLKMKPILSSFSQMNLYHCRIGD